MLNRNESFIAGVIATMPWHAASLRSGRRSCYNSFVAALRAENPHFNELSFRIASNMGEYGAPILPEECEP